MPRSTEMTFTCPCGNVFTTTIYQVVNVTLEPRLLYRLLEGSLNVAVCPNCGRAAEAGQSFLYHDMRRGLFAYVHPDGELPQEERDALLERLRRVYTTAVAESERIIGQQEHPSVRPTQPTQPQLTVRRRRPYDDLADSLEPDAPPMQVIFGAGRLITLVDSLLEPDEKLGRIALSAHGGDPAAHERLARIAGDMAAQMDCDTTVEDAADAPIVWIYGPRARINAIAKALGRPA